MHGYVDVCNATKSGDYLPEAKEVLVFLVTAINAPWKIPVGYFFVAGVTAEQRATLVLQCLELLEETGIQITSLTLFAPSSGNEDLAREIMQQVGSMINARFEGMEERLLPEKRHRPPLAADKRQEANREEADRAKEAGIKASQSKKKKGGKETKSKAGSAQTSQSSQESQSHVPPPVAETINEEGWTTVTKRGKKKKEEVKQTSGARKAPTAAKSSKKKRNVKLRPPRTAAVVITLQPGAEEKGATYAKVLTAAKEKIDLGSCGITSLRFRKAATGARILEVSAGDASAERADSLAQKLREALGEEVARVSRPTKCVEFRVSGLDDSVSKDDIAAATAQRGGCLIGAIKVGEIKRTYQGTGIALVSCPVAAAKKVADEGRLLVGWVSAKVEMVQPRPLRCYRCLETGHVRAQCSAATDRSEECYRCGQSGHKSSTCSATPKCSICAAANKPSAHKLGSKSCAPSRSRRRAQKAAAMPATEPSASSCPASQTGDERAQMDVN